MSESEGTHTDRGPQLSHGRHKRWLWLTGAFVVIALISSVAAIVYVRIKNSTPLDAYTRKVTFPVYYPATLPSGYALDQKSISIYGGLLVYRLTNSDKEPVLVLTEQSMPRDFEANGAVGSSTKALAVPSGTLYDMGTAKQSQHMLTTDSTLIFINSTNKVDTALINTVASNMRQIK